MKKLFLLGFILIGFQFISAQEALNNYKYVIVPKQFSFQKGEDSYRINSLAKFLLDKKQFTTIFENDEFPEDLGRNHCLGVRINLLSRNNIFWTRITVEFLDCQNRVVFKTEEGGSKLKTYLKAYNEAIRNAFKSFGNYQHVYHPLNNTNQLPKETVVVKKADDKVKVPIKEQVKTDVLKKIISKALKLEVVKKATFKLVGLYKFDNDSFEIAAFKNYYIFSKQLKTGAVPLGFIYKTSQKGNYLVKNSKDTFTGYLKDNGNFVVDEINNDGTIKSIVYKKDEN